MSKVIGTVENKEILVDYALGQLAYTYEKIGNYLDDNNIYQKGIHDYIENEIVKKTAQENEENNTNKKDAHQWVKLHGLEVIEADHWEDYKVNAIAPENSIFNAIEGYQLIGTKDIDETGLNAITTKDLDGNIHIAFAGTNETKEWLGTNAFIGLGSPTAEQAKQAYDYAQEIINTQGLDKDSKIYLSGHSLGGGLTEYVTILLYAEGYTNVEGSGFNSPGMAQFTLEALEKAGKNLTDIPFTLYYNPGDITPQLGLHSGKVQALEGTIQTKQNEINFDTHYLCDFTNQDNQLRYSDEPTRLQDIAMITHAMLLKNQQLAGDAENLRRYEEAIREIFGEDYLKDVKLIANAPTELLEKLIGVLKIATVANEYFFNGEYIWEDVKSDIESLINGLKINEEKYQEEMEANLKELIETARDATDEWIKDGADAIKHCISGIKEAMNEELNTLKSLREQYVKKLKESMQEAINKTEHANKEREQALLQIGINGALEISNCIKSSDNIIECKKRLEQIMAQALLKIIQVEVENIGKQAMIFVEWIGKGVTAVGDYLIESRRAIEKLKLEVAQEIAKYGLDKIIAFEEFKKKVMQSGGEFFMDIVRETTAYLLNKEIEKLKCIGNISKDLKLEQLFDGVANLLQGSKNPILECIRTGEWCKIVTEKIGELAKGVISEVRGKFSIQDLLLPITAPGIGLTIQQIKILIDGFGQEANKEIEECSKQMNLLSINERLTTSSKMDNYSLRDIRLKAVAVGSEGSTSYFNKNISTDTNELRILGRKINQLENKFNNYIREIDNVIEKVKIKDSRYDGDYNVSRSRREVIRELEELKVHIKALSKKIGNDGENLTKAAQSYEEEERNIVRNVLLV